jgi:hypothetical protein
MVGALLAEGRIVDAAHRGREPDAALLVEHAVVVVGALAPDLLLAPVGRGRGRLGCGRGMEGRPERFGCVWVRDRHLEECHLVRLRIEDRHLVARVLGRAIERSVGVDGGIAPVRGDEIVDELLLGPPLPGRDDDVALDAGRPLRLAFGQLALGDAVGPITEILEGDAAELSSQPVHHELAGLAGGDAAHPRLRARLELTERGGDRARRLLAELMAADAVDVAHALAPQIAGDVRGDVGSAAEILLGRHLHHRVPVDGGIVMRRRRLARGRHGREVEELAGLCAHLGRIDEPIAAHPHLIVHIAREVGDDVAPLVVGHDHLGEPGGQLRRLRDYPHTGLGPCGPPHHATDVVVVDGDNRLLGCRRRGSRSGEQGR